MSRHADVDLPDTPQSRGGMLTGRQALAHAIDELAPSNIADFRKLTLWGSSNPRFDGRFVDTGWTACHAWRVLDNGRQSSSYGCLNSFTPVLVWVPTPLARSTDREGSGPQTLLKDLAHAYRDVRVPSHLEPYGLFEVERGSWLRPTRE